jgi:hypothetical protein
MRGIEIVERNDWSVWPTAPCGTVPSRVIDQYAPHDVCGDRKEVRPIVPLDACLIDEPEIRLVYEVIRRERVPACFEGELPVRNSREVRIHE